MSSKCYKNSLNLLEKDLTGIFSQENSNMNSVFEINKYVYKKKKKKQRKILFTVRY